MPRPVGVAPCLAPLQGTMPESTSVAHEHALQGAGLRLGTGKKLSPPSLSTPYRGALLSAWRGPQRAAIKARPRFEFGKFNFAGGFHRFRFCTPASLQQFKMLYSFPPCLIYSVLSKLFAMPDFLGVCGASQFWPDSKLP